MKSSKSKPSVVKKSISFPAELLEQIVARAKAQNRSVSNYLQNVARMDIDSAEAVPGGRRG